MLPGKREVKKRVSFVDVAGVVMDGKQILDRGECPRTDVGDFVVVEPSCVGVRTSLKMCKQYGWTRQ